MTFHRKRTPGCGNFFPVKYTLLSFAINTQPTYELVQPKNLENRHKKVWVSQPGSGLDKRQCSLKVCFRPSGFQPRIDVIFRVTGKRISAAEKSSGHPEVDVYFQECAWADTKFCLEWVERKLQPATDDKFVLFYDNLSGQIADELKQKVSDICGVY